MQAKETTFRQALTPVLGLLLCIIIGLIIRPQAFGHPPIPLELIFIGAASIATIHLYYLGYSWEEIQKSIVKKIARGLPTILILFTIGLIIGSWIISGTIPMLVYYGIEFINPTYLYFLAFVVPAIFSSFTGTSWGSIGTIGIVILGVALAVEAHLGIVAGAIIGGSFFGDKLSPLSDTTNIAALATEVDLYDHIHSMLYTTIPSAIIAGIAFLVLGFFFPPTGGSENFLLVDETLLGIKAMFEFHPLLMIPPVYVLYASIRRQPTIPTLLIATGLGSLLAMLFQDYSLTDLVQTLYKGFSHTMFEAPASVPENIQQLFDRGGLYALSEPIIISLMVFIYIGAIDHINAMPIIVDKLFAYASRNSTLVISSLLSTAITNAMTSNQFATSFVIGDAFKSKYDQFKIPRKVLSRSIEDYGTMFESLVPWTTTTIFVTATLQIPYSEYWHWQLFSLANLLVAPTLALFGIGCFYPRSESPAKAQR